MERIKNVAHGLWIVAALLLVVLASTAQARDVEFTVKWRANGEPDLVGYRVYESPNYSGVYSEIADTTETQYIFFKDIPDGTTAVYYYIIKAYDLAGLESEPSEPVPGSTDVPPAQVQEVTVTTRIVVSVSGKEVTVSATSEVEE